MEVFDREMVIFSHRLLRFTQIFKLMGKNLKRLSSLHILTLWITVLEKFEKSFTSYPDIVDNFLHQKLDLFLKSLLTGYSITNYFSDTYNLIYTTFPYCG